MYCVDSFRISVQLVKFWELLAYFAFNLCIQDRKTIFLFTIYTSLNRKTRIQIFFSSNLIIFNPLNKIKNLRKGAVQRTESKLCFLNLSVSHRSHISAYIHVTCEPHHVQVLRNASVHTVAAHSANVKCVLTLVGEITLDANSTSKYPELEPR